MYLLVPLDNFAHSSGVYQVAVPGEAAPRVLHIVTFESLL
jgi:hypothetical protein